MENFFFGLGVGVANNLKLDSNTLLAIGFELVISASPHSFAMSIIDSMDLN